MNRRQLPRSRLPVRLTSIVVAASAMAVLVVALDRARERRAAPVTEPVATVTPPSEPIDAEAAVFRTTVADLAAEPGSPRRRSAHRRTLTMYRALRAYPGAPPRIPHGLTVDEYRNARCTTCHERGGYSQRFEAYAPVTPHPELAGCLQCHLPDARLVGIRLPGGAADALCRQCHARPGPDAAAAGLSWPPATWPAASTRRDEGTPPPIPHDLQTRGNCLACHAGPGAVTELRTRHPERSDCRECHVNAGDEAGEFVRPVPAASATRGGPG